MNVSETCQCRGLKLSGIYNSTPRDKQKLKPDCVLYTIRFFADWDNY